MSKRLGIVLAVLLAASLPLIAASEPDVDDGWKGAAAADAERPAVPASSLLGMLITGVLVLGASTAALLGGGFTPRMLLQRQPPAQAAPAPAATATSEAQPRAERESKAPREQRSVRRSPKNKTKRSFARQRGRENHPRKGWQAAHRRGAPHPGSRKRGGPGCRGVR